MLCFKMILTLVFAIACHSCFAQSGPPPAEGPDRGYVVKVGQQAPDDFVLKLTDGTTTSNKALRGKVVVLQLTASYCTVCRLKFRHLEHELWMPLKEKLYADSRRPG
jgi:cytochrome oxidase Cu insertion factor (SCO1/SenC/PrrC family)